MNALRGAGSVIRREFRLIARDRWTVAALTVVPAVTALVLGLIYREQTVREIPLMVVDQDRSELSRTVIRALDANEFLAVVRTESDDAGMPEALRRGTVEGAVEIPRGFEREIKAGHRQDLLCMIDGANMLIANYGIRGMSAVAGTVSAGISIQKMEKSGVLSSQGAGLPLSTETRLLFNPAQSYSRFFLPGLFVALLQQVVAVGAGLSFAQERNAGSPGGLLLGKFAVYFLIGLGWAVLLGGLGIGFGLPWRSSAPAAALTLALGLSAMTLLALALSAAAPRRETAMQLVFIVTSPAFLLSGYTFPLSAMPKAVSAIAWVLPITPFLTAWRRITLYGGGAADALGPLAILLIMCAVYGVAAYAAAKRKLRHAVPLEVPA